MGKNQKTEGIACISAIVSVIVCWYFTHVFFATANAYWLITARRIAITSLILAMCSGFVFLIGNYHRGFGSIKRTLWSFVRRAGETIALMIVYMMAVGMISAAIMQLTSLIFDKAFATYHEAIVIIMAAVMGYMVYVQAVLMNSRTIASLLPAFVVPGVTAAGMMSDDPYWWQNNFSQLGDRTTFAASLFNFTVILAGICMLIVSYFAVSEIITTHRMYEGRGQKGQKFDQFTIRTTVLVVLLTVASFLFMGVGIWRYSPHPLLHNICARGLTIPMSILMVALPWFVPLLSVSFYVLSDMIFVLIAGYGIYWYAGYTSFTNVEAMAGLLFMGWFILFSRQIAAMEADRIAAQLAMAGKDGVRVEHSRLDPVIL